VSGSQRLARRSETERARSSHGRGRGMLRGSRARSRRGPSLSAGEERSRAWASPFPAPRCFPLWGGRLGDRRATSCLSDFEHLARVAGGGGGFRHGGAGWPVDGPSSDGVLPVRGLRHARSPRWRRGGHALSPTAWRPSSAHRPMTSGVLDLRDLTPLELRDHAKPSTSASPSSRPPRPARPRRTPSPGRPRGPRR
jgi:hypothetical protein